MRCTRGSSSSAASHLSPQRPPASTHHHAQFTPIPPTQVLEHRCLLSILSSPVPAGGLLVGDKRQLPPAPRRRTILRCVRLAYAHPYPPTPTSLVARPRFPNSLRLTAPCAASNCHHGIPGHLPRRLRLCPPERKRNRPGRG